MNAVAYCRVSTLEQSSEGVSLDMQRERIAAWCLGNGYSLEATFVETMSGGRASNRPELLKAITLACKARAVLVVFSLSRLARSVKDTLMISERLEKAGANLASLSERIDTNSALGKMVFRLLSTLNEFERDQLSERTVGAMAYLRRANRRISSRLPLGYNLAEDGLTLIQNDAEQETIRRIHTLHEEGISASAISRLLRNSSTPTKNGGHWYPSTVKAIIIRSEKLTA